MTIAIYIVLHREELSTHNKGKDGYVEKLEFLERADLRFGKWSYPS